MLPSVCALVLNWNGADDAIACLNSLTRQTYPALELLVVDNGSVDDSVARIRRAYPDVTILENSENLGFAGGVNAGLRHALAADYDYILVLNNDLVLAPDCVDEMVTQAQEGNAFVTAMLYYSDEERRIWSIGGNFNHWNLEKTDDARNQIDDGTFPEVLERDFVPGGATLMEARALQQIGLFDEGYFLYYEDMDLGLRAGDAGFRSVVATKARMWHGVARSSGGSDSPRERYWMARSSVRYFSKNARPWQLPLILLWRTGSAVRTTSRLLRTDRNESLRAYWRGLWDGLRDLSRDF